MAFRFFLKSTISTVGLTDIGRNKKKKEKS